MYKYCKESIMARPRTNNVQINIAIPIEWKKELENLARIYSVKEGKGHISEATVKKYIEEQKNED